MADGQSTPSLDFVFGEVSKQLDLQWQVWESVDGRLRLTLGFIGAIFVATLAFADPTRELSTSGKVFLVMANCRTLDIWLNGHLGLAAQPVQ